MPDSAAPLDVIVLAAGRGSRLAALGDDRPKWLLEVNGRTIADRQLAALDELEASRPGRLRGVTILTGHAAEVVDALPLGAGRQTLFNPLYLTLNNWYTVLLALRALPDDGRLVLLNGDLCAPSGWLLRFLEACADTTEPGMLGIDFARPLTEESMKVARRPGTDELLQIGKHEFPDPVGEYVGMLSASGEVLRSFRAELEAFAVDPEATNQWYEGAVGVSASRGTRWHLWPTPSSTWVEIDDLVDLESAGELPDA